jgi:hypothetical protein
VKFILIERRWLRRILMATIGPAFVFQYLWFGLRSMAVEFKGCWDYEHPSKINHVHEGQA